LGSLLGANHEIQWLITLKIGWHDNGLLGLIGSLLRLFLLLQEIIVLLDANDPTANGSAWLGHFLNDVGLKIKFFQIRFFQLSHGTLG
jgi:hypothetical protein